MQIALVFTLLVVAVACQEKYTTKYDNIDLDNILKNERLFKNYVDCLLDKGKCSKEADELKKRIPEALEDECAKCSEKHKNGIRKVVKHLAENRKEWWTELMTKYDPEGSYRKRYEELGKAEGVEV